MQPLILIALVVLLSAGGPAARGDVQTKAIAAVDALDGLDPVLLVGGKEVPGKSAFSVTRDEFIYLFSTAGTKATFEHDPARYEIQRGGMCAKMGKTAGGNPADYIVHDGKIYIFGSDDCHKKFRAEPAKYLATPPAPLPASPSAATGGRQLIERAVAAIGGAARLDALTSYVESVSQIQKRPDGDATITTRTMWSFPHRVRQERTMALQDKTMSSATILAPQGMWFVGGQGQAYPMRPAGRPSPRARLRTPSGRVASSATVSPRSRRWHSARPQSTASASTRSGSSAASLTLRSLSRRAAGSTA
jgi:YHS domain-containing protein